MVINGGRERLYVESVRHYLSDVTRVAEEYGKIGLLVRGGLEFGYFPGCEKEIGDLQKQVNLYLRLGAVHLIDDLCICCGEEAPRVFGRLSLSQFADRYFALMDQAAASGLFDCLAHVDVYRRFGQTHYGNDVLTIHRGRVEKLFETMCSHGVGFEVNTSAIRHGLAEYYPTMEIINLAREQGVSLLTLGSDAHRPSDIALDFDAAIGVAYELTPYVDE
jgi:histidinol-phosphatase (PHP family)